MSLESLKMNDFWPRQPNNFPMDPANDFNMSRNNNNNNQGTFNNNEGVVDLKHDHDHLMSGQEGSNNFNQSTSGFQMNQQQSQPQPVASPGAENSHDAKFNGEKFVNEIQVSLQAILLVALMDTKVFGAQIFPKKETSRK